MNFSVRFSLFLLLDFCVTHCVANKLLNCTASDNNNNNTTNVETDTHIECPVNAICSAVNETTKNFQCTCLPNYVWNPLWQQVISGNNANTNTSNNISVNNNNNNNNNNANSTATAYCLSVNATQTANGKVYVRQPAKVEHLAFGILMVLFVAIAAISLLYLLKVLRPIKRSRAVYTQLRRRHENRERLEEFCDDISMIELNEKR